MEPLTDEEKAIYDWQIDVRDFGVEGQTRLKNSSALVSRIGGLGGSVALELAAAGIGKLILAHAGEVKPSDLNRQILMSYDDIGKSRVEAARRRLLDLNPRLEIEAVNENMSG
ncbi:MAG: ThiF family adenylyltransferase, partial [Candidatus Hydrogenedentota bacterium]